MISRAADRADQYVTFPGLDGVSSIVPMDTALEAVFKLYKLKRLGGASGKGWSSRQTLQRCPYLYKVSYLQGIRGVASKALETGSAFHALLACHYLAMVDSNWPLQPEALRDELLTVQADAEAVSDAWRVYDAYALHYETDYLRPLAVEVLGDHGENTCRWDLIAAIDSADSGFVPGTYLVEHKSSARLDPTTVDAWRGDGEIIGQIAIYQGNRKYARKWGKLQGVVMNLCSKETVPKFKRQVIPPQAWQTDAHLQDLSQWGALETFYKASNFWPRARAGCIGRYGKCALFDHCADGTRLDGQPDE